MDIEIETGTYVRSTPRRRHNGYWAGDFSVAPGDAERDENTFGRLER